jgi:TRAP-type C4-dicarboxylate transport system substrate-binding protein
MQLDTRSVGASVLAVAVLLPGCSTSVPADRSGADTVVLRLATIDGAVNTNGQTFGPEAFVEALEEVSGGRLRVEVTTRYGNGAPDAESRLVEAIAAGDLDGGWPSTRAFANAGIRGLEAVEAPMTLTSYDAQRALVSGPVAEELLARLDGSGIAGLGLTVGPLRRPFAADAPLLDPSDWAGARFRVYNSPVQEDAVGALGAAPVNVGHAWIDELRAGNLRGAEFDIAQYAAMDVAPQAGNVTANVVLWPKVFVLSLSQRRLDALNEQQRAWVREAAEGATRASIEATYDESTLAARLCEQGVRFVPASDGQIAALAEAFGEVVDDLAADEAMFGAIRAIAREHPEVEQPEVPSDCEQVTSGSSADPEVPDEVAPIPDGVYRTELTIDDVESAGVSNADGWSGTWTLEIRDGTYQLACRPLDEPGVDCGQAVTDAPLEAGELRGTGDVAHFLYSVELMASLTGCQLPVSATDADRCWAGWDYVMRWSVDGDELAFEDLGSQFPAPTFTLEAWRRID